MWGSVDVGDWVKANRVLPVSLTDHLIQSGIKPGTRGVVTATSGSRRLVDFDGGFGTVSVWVERRALQVIRYGGGIGSFRSSARRRTIARVAFVLFLAWPFIQFAVAYAWVNKGFDGMTIALADGIVQSVFDWLNMLITQPIKTVIYFGFLWVTGKVALR